MSELKEKIAFIVIASTGILNILTLFSYIISYMIGIINATIATPVFFISMISIIVAAYCWIKYKERCEFIEFIDFLHLHEFDILPKTYLTLDKPQNVNKLHVHEMSITYTNDMKNYNPLDNNQRYNTTIEHELMVKNKNLPKSYGIYAGNIYADKAPIVRERHGNRTNYADVTEVKYHYQTAIQNYSWALNNEYDKRKVSFPISFKFTFESIMPSNLATDIVIFPKKYAKQVDNINFHFNIIGREDIIIKEIRLYHIMKSEGKFELKRYSDIEKEGNKVTIPIPIRNEKYEAYYIQIERELTSPTTA